MTWSLAIFFPDFYTVFHAGTHCSNSNTTRKGAALIAVSRAFYNVQWRADLEIIKAYLRIEIAMGLVIILTYFYVILFCNVRIIENYSYFLNKNLNKILWFYYDVPVGLMAVGFEILTTKMKFKGNWFILRPVPPPPPSARRICFKY
jgi:hypothetical protein